MFSGFVYQRSSVAVVALLPYLGRSRDGRLISLRWQTLRAVGSETSIGGAGLQDWLPERVRSLHVVIALSSGGRQLQVQDLELLRQILCPRFGLSLVQCYAGVELLSELLVDASQHACHRLRLCVTGVKMTGKDVQRREDVVLVLGLL
eukprot:m.466487 g.466487  ORF g.466487 m.466487 type:complete len:148 (-) comp20362_c1_seq50:1695-2138(-)